MGRRIYRQDKDDDAGLILMMWMSGLGWGCEDENKTPASWGRETCISRAQKRWHTQRLYCKQRQRIKFNNIISTIDGLTSCYCCSLVSDVLAGDSACLGQARGKWLDKSFHRDIPSPTVLAFFDFNLIYRAFHLVSEILMVQWYITVPHPIQISPMLPWYIAVPHQIQFRAVS